MKRILRLTCFGLAAIGLLLARPSMAAPAEPLVHAGDRLIFVGNSYMANLGGVYRYLAKAMESAHPGSAIAFDPHIYYGKPLKVMWTPEVREAMTSGKHRGVVFTSGDLETMRQFQSLAREQKLLSVIYMTWDGRHPGHNATPEDYRKSTAENVQLMRQMERETGATIVPLAVIYHDLVTHPVREDLRVDYPWVANNIHQNQLGTMVNAWTLYAVLTGKSPVGLDFDFPPQVVGDVLSEEPDIKFDPEMRRALQQRVWKIVQQWQAGKTEFD